MFGFFTKKKSENDATLRLAEATTQMLNIQLSLCKSSDKVNDDWVLGYIGGFSDGVLQYNGIGTDETGMTIMLIVFGNIFGNEKRFECFRRYASLKEYENTAAWNGDKTGGSEALSCLNGRSQKALGLVAYCHNFEPPV